MKLYRVGWGELEDNVVWEIPLSVCGLWRSGYSDTGVVMMVGLVEAESAAAAEALIRQNRSNLVTWRFTTPVEAYEESDRFPEEAWMKPRLDRWRKRSPETRVVNQYDVEDMRLLQEEFSQAAAPLLAFLQKLDATRHPHWTAVVTADRAELLEGVATMRSTDAYPG